MSRRGVQGRFEVRKTQPVIGICSGPRNLTVMRKMRLHQPRRSGWSLASSWGTQRSVGEEKYLSSGPSFS